jgi:hypothetical protein
MFERHQTSLERSIVYLRIDACYPMTIKNKRNLILLKFTVLFQGFLCFVSFLLLVFSRQLTARLYVHGNVNWLSLIVSYCA